MEYLKYLMPSNYCCLEYLDIWSNDLQSFVDRAVRIHYGETNKPDIILVRTLKGWKEMGRTANETISFEANIPRHLQESVTRYYRYYTLNCLKNYNSQC